MISRLAISLLRKPASDGHKRMLCTFKNGTNLLKLGIWKVGRTNFASNSKPSPDKITVWNKVFGKYLLTTNTISSGLLMVIGDYVAQKIESRRRRKDNEIVELDLKRIWRMFIVGALMGPMHHFVYNWMDRFMPAATIRNTLIKILIDQLVMSPVCILLFFYSACFLENKSITETNEELKSKFIFIYITDWIVWPGAQFINFQYLDIKYRVTFVNVCTAVYNIFLSYMKHDFD